MSNKIEFIESKSYYSKLVSELVEFNNKLYDYLKERNELDLYERIIIQNKESEMVFNSDGYVLTRLNEYIQYKIEYLKYGDNNNDLYWFVYNLYTDLDTDGTSITIDIGDENE